METSIEDIFRFLLKGWKQSYYSKPLLLAVSFCCCIALLKKKENSYLRATSLIFISATFALFLLLDLFVLALYFDKIDSYTTFVKTAESLNVIFSLVEFLTINRLVKLNLENTIIRKISNSIGFAVCLTVIVTLFIILRSDESFYIETVAEASAAISYVELTILLLSYFIIIYKRSITATFSFPSIFAMFCYVALSLLLFPYSALFIENNQKLGFLLSTYHILLLTLLCLTLAYNTLYHKAKAVTYLNFET